MARTVRLDALEQFTAINLLNDPGFDPTPRPIPNCMEVRLNWTLDGNRTAHNVLHARFPGTYPGTITLANSIQSAVNSALSSSALLAQLANTTSFAGVSLRDKSNLNQPYVDSSGAAVSGTAAGPALPHEVAAVLTERTAIVGPGGRGRIYMVGFTQVAAVAGNVISPALVAALTAFGPALRSGINGTGVTMCLMLPSRVAYTGSTGTTHPARAPGTQDVISVVNRDNHWDSQRRRGLK